MNRSGASQKMTKGTPRRRPVVSGIQRLARIAICTGVFIGTFSHHHAQASVTYGYDSVSRIRTALYDDGTCIVYGYDAVGNLLSQTNYAPPQSTLPVWGSATWGNYTWSSSDQVATWGSGIWGCSSWSP